MALTLIYIATDIGKREREREKEGEGEGRDRKVLINSLLFSGSLKRCASDSRKP